MRVLGWAPAAISLFIFYHLNAPLLSLASPADPGAAWLARRAGGYNYLPVPFTGSMTFATRVITTVQASACTSCKASPPPPSSNPIPTLTLIPVTNDSTSHNPPFDQNSQSSPSPPPAQQPSDDQGGSAALPRSPQGAVTPSPAVPNGSAGGSESAVPPPSKPSPSPTDANPAVKAGVTGLNYIPIPFNTGTFGNSSRIFTTNGAIGGSPYRMMPSHRFCTLVLMQSALAVLRLTL